MPTLSRSRSCSRARAQPRSRNRRRYRHPTHASHRRAAGHWWSPSATSTTSSSGSSCSSSRHRSKSQVRGVPNRKQKLPSKTQRTEALRVLRTFGFGAFHEIAKGGYGYVYSTEYTTRSTSPHIPSTTWTVVLKIVLERKNQTLYTNAERMRNRFRGAVHRMYLERKRSGSLSSLTRSSRLYGRLPHHARATIATRRGRGGARSPPSSTLRSSSERVQATCVQQPEQQYYVDDMVFRLPSLAPAVTFHLMEKIPGVDLKVYFKAFGRQLHGKARASDPTIPDTSFASVQRTFCSLVQAVQFLQRTRVVFNDLKLENVIVDPNRPDIVLIDYIDSNHSCSRLRCPELHDYRVIRTYEDEYNDEPSFAEDIWRVGLMMLDAMMLMFKDQFGGNYPSEQIKDAFDESFSTYPTELIHNLIDACIGLVQEHYVSTYAATRSSSLLTYLNALRDTLRKMLHKRPAERPLARHLLTQPRYVFHRCHSQYPTAPLSRERCQAKEAMFMVRKDLMRRLKVWRKSKGDSIE